MSQPKNVYAVKLRRAKNGNVSAAIVAGGRRPVLKKHGKIFSLLDIEVTIQNKICYLGEYYPAKMVLKIYCKVPEHIASRALRIRKLNELRKLNPILFPHAHTKNLRKAWSRPKGIKDVFYPEDPVEKARRLERADPE